MFKENLFTRDDTLIGVCQGLGEDFGFNPNWLRLAFGVSLLLNPAAVVGTYAALGVVVFASRMIVRDPRPAQEPRTAAEAQPEQAAALQPELPLAA